MKKVLIILFILILSCDKDKGVPVDPAIVSFTQALTGTWKALNTQIYFGPSSHIVLYPDSVNCSYEKQFDIVKQMTITSGLIVTNTYACTPTRTTNFEITKEQTGASFFITEKDVNNNLIK